MEGRYIVWWTTGKHDGDSAFADLHDAEREFEHQKVRRTIVEVEIFDRKLQKFLSRWSAEEERDAAR